jgi:sortase A
MLNIPRLGVSLVVLEGSDDIVLKKGPGHIEDTAYPGEPGNIAIAAHRDTHFRPLRNIRQNDEVVVSTNLQTIRYFVDSIQILQPSDTEILDPTPGPALTLVTCFPFEFIGNAPRRFVVRATPRASPH